MKGWAEYPIMEHAAWRKGKCTRNQDTADIKADHVSTVRFDIAPASRKVSCRGAVERNKAERVDETEIPQKPWSDLSWHEERRESCRDHQEEIDTSKPLVSRRPFSPRKQECADEKCGHYRRQMEIGKLQICHGNVVAHLELRTLRYCGVPPERDVMAHASYPTRSR